MHLLLIHQNFPGQFRDLAPAWLAAGHQLTAISEDAPASDEQNWPDLRQWSYSIATADGEQPSPLERSQAVAQITRELQRRQSPPDLVLVHSGWGEALKLRRVLPHTPLVVYPEIWGTPQAQGFGIDPDLDPLLPRLQQASLLPWLRRPVERQNLLAALAIAQADAVVVPSPSQQASFPPALRQRMELIPEGVDAQRLQPDPQAQLALPGIGTLRAGDPLITLVSRELEPLRGLRAALRAWPAVRASHPSARLLLVGGSSGGYGWEPPQGASHLEDALAELPAPAADLGIHVLGTLPYADLLRLLQCSAGHLGLSYPHTLSWSLLEAMACGAPVISNHGSPLAAVVEHNQHGLLVPFADSAALSDAILQLLQHPDERQRLAKAGRQLVIERFSLQQALERYEALFQRLIH